MVETTRQECQVCETPRTELSKKGFFSFYFLCTNVSTARVFVYHMHAVSSEAREGLQIPGN